MARLARLVIPGLPHHLTQRGNRRQQTFFSDGDYAVRAGLVADAGEWPWSSAKAHLMGRNGRLVNGARLPEMIADWRAFLDRGVREEELRDLREHGRTGRPLGSASFLDRLESIVGRVLRPQKGGRPSRLRKLP